MASMCPRQATQLTTAEAKAARKADEAKAAVDAAKSANAAALERVQAANEAWQAALRNRAVR